MSLLLDSAHLH